MWFTLLSWHYHVFHSHIDMLIILRLPQRIQELLRAEHSTMLLKRLQYLLGPLIQAYLTRQLLSTCLIVMSLSSQLHSCLTTTQRVCTLVLFSCYIGFVLFTTS